MLADLMSLPVYQQLVGTVTLFHVGNDLLEVRKEALLIPFVKTIVPVVDLEAQRIEITPPLVVCQG